MKTIGPYTEEVVKHFRHPHNYGKMEDPDGVGRVGNLTCGDVMELYIKVKKDKKGREILSDVRFQTFGCLPPNEKVLINEGDWKDAAEISIGHEVLNSNGEKTGVLETYVRDYNGIMLTFIPFVSPFNKFSVTPEHPILCIKRESIKSKKKFGRCDWFQVGKNELASAKPDFVEAMNIEPGDYLVFVPNHETRDSESFTTELMQLLGYYLAEGYITANGNVVTFSFNRNEKDNINELDELIRKVIRKEPKHRTRRNATEVYVCSKQWADFFVSKCSKLARHKKISKEILLLPFEKQWEMVLTYIKGDGNLYRRRSSDSLTCRMATASENLAVQMQEILARGGIFSSIRIIDRPDRAFIEGRKVDAKELYQISFKLTRKHKFVHHNGNHFLVPVRKVEKDHYEGKVYNFHVKGNPESYLVRGFAVHNCVAAISTSSVITDIAKGETLDEAIKISREEIVDSLGGLPPVKLHCSVLSADALAEAIYDYLTKNKRPIPKELEERHLRIQKEKGEVGERYKDWIKIEEDMFKGSVKRPHSKK